MTPADQDNEHLRLLSIFHYIVGGILALSACIPIVHVVIGAAFLIHPQGFAGGGQSPFPAEMLGVMFITIGSFIILVGWATAALIVVSGRFLAKRKRYTYCLVVAAVSCIFFPFGTALGVLTLVVLLRASVKPMFT